MDLKRKKTNSFAEGVMFKTPEQDLFKAVLCRSIRDYQFPESSKDRAEAFAWFLCQDSESPFSFISICRILNINKKRILKNLKLNDYF